MAIEVSTLDCVSIQDKDIKSVLELCSQLEVPLTEEFIIAEKDRWVLFSKATENDKLKGFSFFTLDRIGGTPSIVPGMSAVACYSKRKTVMRGLMAEQFKRALISFPEEDVLFGVRLENISGYDLFWEMHDIVPRPSYNANGEDRAWGKRLIKRFGLSESAYDPKIFAVSGNGSPSAVWYYRSHEKDTADKTRIGAAGSGITRKELKSLFKSINATQGDSLIVHGWIRKEDLLKYPS